MKVIPWKSEEVRKCGNIGKHWEPLSKQRNRDTVVGRRISMSIRHTEVSSVAIARIVKGGSSLATRRSLRTGGRGGGREVTVSLSSYFYGT